MLTFWLTLMFGLLAFTSAIGFVVAAVKIDNEGLFLVAAILGILSICTAVEVIEQAEKIDSSTVGKAPEGG